MTCNRCFWDFSFYYIFKLAVWKKNSLASNMIIQTEHWESCWFFIQFILQVRVFNGHLMSKIPGNAYWVALLLFGCSLLRQCFLTQTFSTCILENSQRLYHSPPPPLHPTLLSFAGVGMIYFDLRFLFTSSFLSCCDI